MQKRKLVGDPEGAKGGAQGSKQEREREREKTPKELGEKRAEEARARKGKEQRTVVRPKGKGKRKTDRKR